jgi:hypothetical protein
VRNGGPLGDSEMESSGRAPRRTPHEDPSQVAHSTTGDRDERTERAEGETTGHCDP